MAKGLTTPPAGEAAPDDPAPPWAGKPWQAEFAAWVARERRPGGELYDPRTDPTL